MTIEDATVVLFSYYNDALMMNAECEKDVIENPVAWALYQTWEYAEGERTMNDKHDRK